MGVGRSVGRGVGTGVGKGVGFLVGAGDGLGVGFLVGAGVGRFVGDGVGRFVGEGVGLLQYCLIGKENGSDLFLTTRIGHNNTDALAQEMSLLSGRWGGPLSR